MIQYKEIRLPNGKRVSKLQLIPSGTIKSKKLAEKISKNMAIPIADILVMFAELQGEMITALLEGKSVEIDGIGTFFFGVSGKEMEGKMEVRVNNVEFAPSVHLKRLYPQVQLKKIGK